MKLLAPVAAAGSGDIAVLLGSLGPSERAVDLDAPDLSQALTDAGLPYADFIVDDANGVGSEQVAQAQAALTNGAKVLIVDPVDSATAAAIGKDAAARGVKVIAYDTFAGSGASYYVGYGSEAVGKLLGDGLVGCVTSWKVRRPHVLELTDANGGTGAAELMKGVDAALQPLLASGRYTKSGDLTVPSGDTAAAAVARALHSHPGINAVLVTDDSLSTAVVADLKAAGVPARHVAVAGQGATTQSLVDILEGYQCMAAYEPVSAEAQAAAAVALYLRAGRPVPRGLINATTTGVGSSHAPSVLLTPEAVTARNIAATVAGGDVSADQLCSGSLAAICRKAGITP
jgi:D-xylose transport system substrate-binding protein